MKKSKTTRVLCDLDSAEMKIAVNDLVGKLLSEEKDKSLGFFKKKPHKRVLFNQDELEKLVHASDKYERLKAIVLQYNGLCELISNYVLLNNLLGQSIQHVDEEYSSSHFTFGRTDDEIHLNIDLDALDKPIIKGSHILEIFTEHEKMLAYLQDIYPFSLLAPEEKLLVDSRIDQELIQSKLDALDDGAYVKLLLFNKTAKNFQGHSTLIKKTGDNYSFFEPSFGEFLELNLAQLIGKIEQSIKIGNANGVAMLNGQHYAALLLNKNKEDKDDPQQILSAITVP